MADIKDQLVKNTYNYVLQSDLSTGYVYRIGGDVPVNPIFSSGLTILDNFKYSNGTEQNGYVLYSDGSGNAYWGPVSGSSSGGNFLPLSGGTVTGNTTFTSGLTVNYIDFDTTPNVPNPTGGTLFFDSTENALSYKPITNNNDVTINIGQENVIRVFNNSGQQINNGQVCVITGTTGDFSTIGLALAVNGPTQFIVDGVATHDIPNNQFGFITRFGHVHDMNLSSFSNGEYLYLSQTTPGGYSQFADLSFTGRVSQVGYVISATTNGVLEVSILNEDYISNITSLERNILIGNTSSTGVFEFSGLTIDTPSGTTFSVAPVKGWLIDNTTNSIDPSVQYISYSGGTGIQSLYYSSATETYILLTSAATIIQQTTFPTPIQRRQNIYLGKFGHGTRQFLINSFPEPDLEISPMSQVRDMFTPIKLINDGVYPSANGANLSFNTSSGYLWGLGINFTNSVLDPSRLTVNGQSPATFQYRTQTGGTFGNRTTIDPTRWDVGGVSTAIVGTKATNQRIYLLQNGQIRVQYGQNEYNQLSAAIAAIQTESFITFPNFRDNGILIGILSILSTCSDLTDTSKAQFFFVSKFGEIVGAAGGSSTTTLQQAYNNSSTPEIVINAALDGLSIKNGTGNPDNVSNLLEGINASDVTTSFIRANGDFSGSTYYGNGSGLTHVFNHVKINNTTQFSANTNTSINFSGVNVNILSGTNNTLIFSAGTGGGNPSGVDVFVTGGTYNGGQLLFTNNTGGTFTVTGVTASGLSANYYGSFSDTTNQPVSGANTATVWRLNTTELSNGISISGGSRIQVANKGIYEIGYSAQIEKTQGTSANVTIWAKVNGNDVDRSSSTLGLVSNSVYQLPFVSYILDLNANDYVEFYFSSDNQDVQLTTLSGLVTPTRPVSPSLIVVAKQVGLSAGNSFTGGTVSGATNFVGGLSANTISATTITADDTPKVIYRLPNAVNVGNTVATTVTTITTFDITGLQVGMTIVADGLFSSTSSANQKTYQLSLSGAASNPTVTTTTGGHRAQLLMRIQGSNTIRMSLANAFGATAINPVFVDVTGSAGVFTFVARCTVNGTGGGTPVNTLESLTLTRF